MNSCNRAAVFRSSCHLAPGRHGSRAGPLKPIGGEPCSLPLSSGGPGGRKLFAALERGGVAATAKPLGRATSPAVTRQPCAESHPRGRSSVRQIPALRKNLFHRSCSRLKCGTRLCRGRLFYNEGHWRFPAAQNPPRSRKGLEGRSCARRSREQAIVSSKCISQGG